jgi:hypothetical protein
MRNDFYLIDILQGLILFDTKSCGEGELVRQGGLYCWQ